MSSITFLHKEIKEHVKNGEKTVSEEYIIDGKQGVTIKYYSKDKNGIYKIIIKGNGDDYKMKTIDGENVSEKILTKSELMSELKKNKKLKFASDFASTQKGGALLHRTRKSTKHASKKNTKKRSKKGTKKQSKKSRTKRE